MIYLFIYMWLIITFQIIIQHYTENSWKKDFLSVLWYIMYWLLIILFFSNEILYMHIVWILWVFIFIFMFIFRVLPVLNLNLNSFEIWEKSSIVSKLTWIKNIDNFDIEKNIEKEKNRLWLLIKINSILWLTYLWLFIYYIFLFTNN